MLHNINKKFNILVLVASVSLGLGLSGCGSSDSSPEPEVKADNGAKISGTASKGIIKGGLVTAEELNAGGDVISQLGTAVTDENGTYSLTLGNQYQGGPIQISVSTNNRTQMKCDVPVGCGTLAGSGNAIAFGAFYTPSSFIMTALLPSVQANEVLSVNVTPFTHMAAVRAKVAAILNANAIANANSEVSSLLGGIDILNTAPIDITDPAAVNSAKVSATQVTYAALASALANQGLVDAQGQPDLNAAITLLANSFLAGALEADDAAGDDGAQISLQEIVSAAESTFNKLGLKDVTGKLGQLQLVIDEAVTNDSIIDPDESETVNETDVDKAKAMMRDIRTWGNVIKAEAGTSAQAFTTEVTLASDAVGVLSSVGLSDALAAATYASLKFDATQTELSNVFYDDVRLASNFESGTITLSAAGAIIITNGVVNGYSVNATISGPQDGTAASQFTIAVTSATVVGVNNSMSINSGVVKIELAEPYTVNYELIDYDSLFASTATSSPAAQENGINTIIVAAPRQIALSDAAVVVDPVITDLTFDLNVEFTQMVKADGSALASPVTFSGALTFDLDVIPVMNNIEDKVLPKNFSLLGSISNTKGDSFTATLVANVSNTDTFQFVGDYAPNGTLYSANHAEPFVQWSYSDTDAIEGNDTYTYTVPDYTYQVYWDAQTNAVSYSYTYNCEGCVYISEPNGNYDSLIRYLRSSYREPNVYASVKGEGLYYVYTRGSNFSKNGTLDGQLIDPDFINESSTSWIDADIGLTFVAQLTDLPEATINITADRDGFDAGRGEVTISYGTRQLKLSATVADSQLNGNLVITNQDNMVLTIDTIDRTETVVPLLSGSLTYNGIEVASVIETESGLLKVTYTDGTFEVF